MSQGPEHTELALLVASLVWLTLAALRAFGLPGAVAREVATGVPVPGEAVGGAR
ncbi:MULTISPECIES: hypothetical protein [unclassified Leucobacter]|uniref:hypothetical protein n=1 Tax=unclassified Leucobacter TaxID=2621730 RepID=UPI00130476C8|nr:MULTISPECIES: hypothetical protein [unclassified Leucobacter]